MREAFSFIILAIPIIIEKDIKISQNNLEFLASLKDLFPPFFIINLSVSEGSLINFFALELIKEMPITGIIMLIPSTIINSLDPQDVNN